MIDVYGYLVNESEVIGCGPLRVKQSTSTDMPTEKEYYFEVCTRQSRFTIATGWLPFEEEKRETSVQAFKAIGEAHKALRNCLISGSFTELSVTADPNY